MLETLGLFYCFQMISLEGFWNHFIIISKFFFKIFVVFTLWHWRTMLIIAGYKSGSVRMASKKFRWNAIAVAWLSWTESVSVWTLARTYSSSSPLNSQSWENTFRSHGMHAIKRLSLSKWPTTATTSTIPNAQWLKRGWLFLIFQNIFLMIISLKMAHYIIH